MTVISIDIIELEGKKIKLGVIFDTHVPTRAKQIPQKVLNTFKQENVDYILHAGDLVNNDIVEILESIAPVIAVSGNMDPPSVVNRYPKTRTIKINDLKIGLTHRPKRINFIKEKGWKLLIHGHTHRPKVDKLDSVSIINPGSVTDPRQSEKSFMIIKIYDNKIKPNLIKVEN